MTINIRLTLLSHSSKIQLVNLRNDNSASQNEKAFCFEINHNLPNKLSFLEIKTLF